MKPKQELFCLEYLKDLNGTQAAIRAGYSARSAASQAEALLRNPEIAARVREGIEERKERIKVEADDVLLELLSVMRSDLQHYEIDPETGVGYKPDAPKTASKAVASIKMKVSRFGEDGESREVEFKLWDKTRAIDMAMRHLGMFAAEKQLQLDLSKLNEEQLQRIASGEDPVQVMIAKPECNQK